MERRCGGGDRILELMRLLLGMEIIKAVPIVEDRPRDGASRSRGVDARGRGRVHHCVVGNVVVSTSSIGGERRARHLRGS